MIKLLYSCYRYLIKKKIRGNRIHHENVNYEKAKDIGILFYSTRRENSEAIHQFLYQLKTQDKSFQIIQYLDKFNAVSLQYDTIKISDKDINWIGSFSKPEVNEFIKNPFDILYCISDSLPLPFELILSESKAKFRIGKYYQGKEELFDFMIDTKLNTSIAFLIEQIVHFSGVIRK